MSGNISCPVSFVMVNENRVRITALFIFLACLSYLAAPGWGIPACLAVDFFLRASGKGRYSLLNLLSGWIVRLLSMGHKPIDQGPKRFAAWIGVGMSGALLITDVCGLPILAYVIVAVLAVFSFLESAFGFCAGCHVYTLMKRLFPASDIK